MRNLPIQIGYFRQFNGLRQVQMISKRYRQMVRRLSFCVFEKREIVASAIA